MKDWITEQDREFVAGICRKYPQLDCKNLLNLVNYVRDDFDYARQVNDGLKPLRMADVEEFKKKLAPGTKIIRIVIETNKGPLVIYNYGNIFKNFVVTARKVFSKFKDYCENDKRVDHHLSYQRPAQRIYRYFSRSEFEEIYGDLTPLGPWARRVVIGMFLQYFQLWENTPIKSEEEWNENKTSDLTYRHYLVSVVKSHEKKVREDFVVGKV